MKRKTVALYDPYLDVMGGGEKHILSILKVLQDEGFDPTIFWNNNLSAEIKQKLALSFNPEITFVSNMFTDHASVISKMNSLHQYDLFIYVTDGSYFFSTAKKNFIFCMVPQKSLYNMTFANKIKTMNATFISNSKYTQKLLESWQVHSEVIYPFISEDFFQNYSDKKEKNILVVGRFFQQLHSKRQDIAIKWFTQFQKDGKFTDYKLVLAGSIKDEDKAYYEELQQLAKENKNIQFNPNCSFDELLKLYKKADIYWHMTGFDIDEKKYPEKVEHLGITPLEAMASGCIVFGYNAGGLKELITDNSNGYLFSDEKEILKKMEHIIDNAELKNTIRTKALDFVKNQFNYSIFKKRVTEILL